MVSEADSLIGSTDSQLDREFWIIDYVNSTSHNLFVEVPEEFIDDDFNLTGLSSIVPYYNESLECILDLEPEVSEAIALNDPTLEELERAAELLYGLIHARYIITRAGLNLMAQKYEAGDFGRCPRFLCRETHLIPTSEHDLPGYDSVRFYCPCCRDIYDHQSARTSDVDGAFFGSSFAGLLMEAFPIIEMDCMQKRNNIFRLTIFGFNIAESAKAGPRMRWLRTEPENKEDLDKVNDNNNEMSVDEEGSLMSVDPSVSEK